MKGHIRERSPGHWAIVLDVRDPDTGKRKRKWHSFRGTKRQAQNESARLISALNGGTYLEPNKTTVAQFLDRWLDDIRSKVAPRTHERYAEIARKNLAPLLGSIIITKFSPCRFPMPTVVSRQWPQGRHGWVIAANSPPYAPRPETSNGSGCAVATDSPQSSRRR